MTLPVRPFLRPFFLLLLSVVLLNFSLPPYPMGCVLGWFALVPFFLGLFSLPRFRFPLLAAYAYGFSLGFFYHAAVIGWTLSAWSAWHRSLMAGAVSSLLLYGYFAVWYGFFAAGAFWIHGKFSGRHRVMFLPLLLAAQWVASEILLHLSMGGLVWTSIAYSQWAFLPLLQVLSVAGIYGVSFLLVWSNAAIALSGLRARALAPPALAVLAVALWGAEFLKNNPPANAPGFAVGVLHSAVKLEKQMEPGFDDGVLAAHENSLDVMGSAPAVVIWPETAVPDMKPEMEDRFIRRIQAMIARTGTFHLAGAMTYRSPDRPGEFPAGFQADPEVSHPAASPQTIPLAQGLSWTLRLPPRAMVTRASHIRFNSAVLFSPLGVPISVYHKIRPVFFAETSPLFGWGLGGRATVRPGKDATLFSIPSGAGPEGGEVRLGATICWEPAFPGIVRGFVKNGAQVVANLCEGMWYRGLKRPVAQIFLMGRCRAIENRRALVISGNDMGSGAFDPWGRIQREVPASNGFFVEEVQVRSDLTPYTRWGDWFAWSCLALVAASAAALKFLRR